MWGYNRICAAAASLFVEFFLFCSLKIDLCQAKQQTPSLCCSTDNYFTCTSSNKSVSTDYYITITKIYINLI